MNLRLNVVNDISLNYVVYNISYIDLKEFHNESNSDHVSFDKNQHIFESVYPKFYFFRVLPHWSNIYKLHV